MISILRFPVFADRPGTLSMKRRNDRIRRSNSNPGKNGDLTWNCIRH